MLQRTDSTAVPNYQEKEPHRRQMNIIITFLRLGQRNDAKDNFNAIVL
jgi:hypothetical protein